MFATSFSLQSTTLRQSMILRTQKSIVEEFSNDDSSNSKRSGMSRRNLLDSTRASAFAAMAGGTLLPWVCSSEIALAAATNGPIAVVGASGRTGKLCVDAVRNE